MSQSTNPYSRKQIQSFLFRLGQSDHKQLEQLIGPDLLDSVLQQTGDRWRMKVFTPSIAFCLFLHQVLHPKSSRRSTLALFCLWLLTQGKAAIGASTGGTMQSPKASLARSLPNRHPKSGSNHLESIPTLLALETASGQNR